MPFFGEAAIHIVRRVDAQRIQHLFGSEQTPVVRLDFHGIDVDDGRGVMPPCLEMQTLHFGGGIKLDQIGLQPVLAARENDAVFGGIEIEYAVIAIKRLAILAIHHEHESIRARAAFENIYVGSVCRATAIYSVIPLN